MPRVAPSRSIGSPPAPIWPSLKSKPRSSSTNDFSGIFGVGNCLLTATAGDLGTAAAGVGRFAICARAGSAARIKAAYFISFLPIHREQLLRGGALLRLVQLLRGIQQLLVRLAEVRGDLRGL